LVLPALLLNYFGQGGLLLDNPSLVHNPFYTLAPKFLLIPLLILATAATIIASQAVISGAYSLTLQAIQMGYCPRFVIQHTSADEKGQIYIPEINWSLMLATISLVYIFRTSSHLAAAYGVSVTTTMVITTIIFFEVVRTKFKWPLWACILFLIGFLIIDLAFFSANIVKIAHGAWFPLVIGLFTFVLFKTWRDGRDLLAKRFQEKSMRYDLFFKDIQENPPQRIPGKAVFMTGNLDIIPPALLQNLAHNKILHETVIFMTIITHNDPRVPGEDKVEVKDLGNGFFRVTAHFGFFEEPNMPYIFALVREKGLDLKLLETSFFLGRENLLATKRPGMAIWRERLFAFMSKNARSATAFYRIPPEIVVELGAQIEL
jgi:KUP system potassium uptake protein